ncbi:MAG: MFS transporter [Oscillospiraceae bacterium]|jgi:MFS family permease|nr:MFS transporter [Oscillospiraceae bacterium]
MRKPWILNNKNFSLVVLGQIISIFGASLLRFALSLFVLDITKSPETYAALYGMSSVPVLLSPLGGAFADRFNRRNLMVIFDFTSSGVILGLFFLVSAGLHAVAPIGVIMVILAFISSLYTPTVTASIPLLVENERLESANGIVQAVPAISNVAAPVLGGGLYGVAGIRTLVLISCAAFFASAVMEIFIKIPFVKRETDSNIIKVIAKDMKDGIAYVVKQSFILKSVTLAAIFNFALIPLMVVGAPIILRVTMQSSDMMQGVGIALIGLSSILGALTIGIFAKRIHVRTIYREISMVALFLLPMAAAVVPPVLRLGYLPSFALFMGGAIPIAMAGTIISIIVLAKMQRVTSNENLGKVMAITMAAAQCVAPLGQVAYGFIFGAFKNHLYYPILGVFLIVLGIAAFARRIFRNEPEIE